MDKRGPYFLYDLISHFLQIEIPGIWHMAIFKGFTLDKF